jgi:serine/threonine protein kinase
MAGTRGKIFSFNHSFYRVKLALDLSTNKRVAIKFLRVSNKAISKHKALECLIKEIKILSDCDHPNVARIIEASLDGFLVKEYPVTHLSPNEGGTAHPSILSQLGASDSSSLLLESEAPDNPFVEKVRRKSSICYYVMKLAEYGELYNFIEHTDRFTERLARTLYV